MSANDPMAVVEQQDDWELSKENFQPVKSGRKPAGLTDPLKAAGNLSIDEQRQKYIDSIDNYKGDDPLEVWLRYIKWTQETFKSGGHKSELLPLLERCTRELQKIQRYQTDIRYLRVWIQYADCLPDPSDVFAFLKEHDIGQEHSLFYIAHATFLEVRGSYSSADNAYQQGINRMAQPLDRLKAKFNDFQHRMARRIQRKAQEQGGDNEADQDHHPERQSLALLGGRRIRSHGSSAHSAGVTSQKRKAIATPGRDSAPAGNGGLDIFIDEEFGGNPLMSDTANNSSRAPHASVGGWENLPTFEQARKENVQKASTWTGQRMKQKSMYAAPAAPALDIPLDPEFERQDTMIRNEAVSDKHHHHNDAMSLRQRLESSAAGVDEELAHNPLCFYSSSNNDNNNNNTISSSAIVSSTAAHSLPLPQQQPRANRQVIACDVDVLNSTLGGFDELSFEEIRSRSWKPRQQQAQKQHVHVAQHLDMKATPFDQGVECTAASPIIIPLAREDASTRDSQHTAASPDNASSPRIKNGGPSLTRDITMTTRGAFAAANAMFARGLGEHHHHHVVVGDDGSVASPSQTASGDINALNYTTAINTNTINTNAINNNTINDGDMNNMTMATKDAFAAINTMFKDSLRSNHSSASSMIEPTMTISTKAAFEALNAAFAGSSKYRSTSQSFNSKNSCGSNDDNVDNATDESPTRLFVRQDTSMRSDIDNFPNNGDDETSSDGLGIREDTIFIKNNNVSSAMMMNGALQCDGLSIREDTIFIKNPAQTIYNNNNNDTIIIDDDDMTTRVINRNEDRASTGLTANFKDMRLSGFQSHQNRHASDGIDEIENDENRPTTDQHRNHVPRDIRHPCVATKVLQPLSLPIESNPEAESALAMPCIDGSSSIDPDPRSSDLLLGDDFEVYHDNDNDKDNVGNAEDHQGCKEKDSLEIHNASTLEHHAIERTSLFSNKDDALINPFAASFQQHMLSMLDPPVAQWPDVSLMTDKEESMALHAFKRSASGSSNTEMSFTVESVPGREFTIKKSIGAGAYATVYHAMTALENNNSDSDMALKVESPSCPWEWYICKVIAGRVAPSLRNCFINPSMLLLGSTTSILAMPRGGYGSVQDLLNSYLARGQRPDEVIVARLAVCLLKSLNALHNDARVLHNDIKPDNILVTLERGGGRVGSSNNNNKSGGVIMEEKQDDDENSLPVLGVQFIDFGRSIDLELLPSNALLVGDGGADLFRCVEMREGHPWLWQADAYATAGVLHCLLFGEYMDVERVVETATGCSSLRMKSQLRRYWQIDMWNKVFSTLLNFSGSDAGTRELNALIDMIEGWLGSSREVVRKERMEMSRLFSTFLSKS